MHNVHTFQVAGKPEIFVNDLGNSLWKPYVAGHGLVHLDPATCTFNTSTVVNQPQGGMHVRASAQDIDDASTVYALTQEPAGRPSRLFVLQLVQARPVGFRITATVVLPARGPHPGEGGADVISLGRKMVLVTDRFGAPGPGMMYLYDLSDAVRAAPPAAGAAQPAAAAARSGAPTPLHAWPLGTNPRFTALIGDAVVSANDKNQRGKVRRPFHLSLLLTASRMVLPQDPSTGPHVSWLCRARSSR